LLDAFQWTADVGPGCAVAQIHVGKDGRVISYTMKRYRGSTEQYWYSAIKGISFAPSRRAWDGLPSIKSVMPPEER
jgi:hypothetical protein